MAGPTPVELERMADDASRMHKAAVAALEFEPKASGEARACAEALKRHANGVRCAVQAWRKVAAGRRA
ncbi:MAG: hypothetical protein AB7O67_16545 [Vicinamibacterales bacterium]